MYSFGNHDLLINMKVFLVLCFVAMCLVAAQQQDQPYVKRAAIPPGYELVLEKAEPAYNEDSQLDSPIILVLRPKQKDTDHPDVRPKRDLPPKFENLFWVPDDKATTH
ncbi:unnamed protein product [Nezara viridula]|uniref:Neuropeptide n=1 Tax=Nezara viridula TaxID=85310 RepID=A0A9P0H927_NEZVI|nr:unnamed protein product [Nezara viridula]